MELIIKRVFSQKVPSALFIYLLYLNNLWIEYNLVLWFLLQSLFEIMTSEKSYLLSMQLLVDHFMNDKELKQAIGQNDPIGHHHLFSNATEIVEASREWEIFNILTLLRFEFGIKLISFGVFLNDSQAVPLFRFAMI